MPYAISTDPRLGTRAPTRMAAVAAALAAALAISPPANAQAPAADAQIMAATLPLPEPMRAGATVLGYDEATEPIQLRAGTNGIICLADDPSDDRYRGVCYAAPLHPLLARDRELRKEGLEEAEREEILEAEVRAGEIVLPAHPAAMHIIAGPVDSYDAANHSMSDDARRWKIILTPYRTAEEMGLPTERVDDAPWVMDSGRLFAHIMVLPAGEEGGEE